jgi:ABC-2 type transport system ATP-binding protein
VISKRLLAGRTVLNVMAETCPEGFTSATAGLEDLYFSTLLSHRRQAA